jgi:hypothetical protein
MTRVRRSFKRARIAVAVGVFLIEALAATGCGRDGAGSITVGDPGKWNKPPEAVDARKRSTRPTPTKSQNAPLAGRSIKEQLKEQIKSRGSGTVR